MRALTPPKRRRRKAVSRSAAKRAGTRPTARGKGKWQTAVYSGRAGSRSYHVYVPPDVNPRRRVPLLVLLHGCDQAPAEFAAATRFDELADHNGCIVVFPEQTAWRHRNRCWRWYEAAHQGRQSGEPAIIAAITAQVLAERKRWRIDPSQVYVAGLSAGGAMAIVLGATYPDMYAAVGVHSSPAYQSASGGTDALRAMAGRTPVPRPTAGGARMPPTVIFQGSFDTTVNPRNGQRVTEQWLAYQAGAVGAKDPDRITRSTTRRARSADGRAYSTTRWYTARGRKALEYWLVDGLGHAWSGGARGASYSDPRGPRATSAMASFFAPSGWSESGFAVTPRASPYAPAEDPCHLVSTAGPASDTRSRTGAARPRWSSGRRIS